MQADWQDAGKRIRIGSMIILLYQSPIFVPVLPDLSGQCDRSGYHA